MQNTPDLRLVKGNQPTRNTVKFTEQQPLDPRLDMTPAERLRADRKELVEKIGGLLSKATPRMPEHEVMVWMQSMDAKLDQVLALLRENGGADA